MQIVTIAATNYLAQVRVLARSFQEHHPDGRCAVFFVDDLDETFDPTDEPFDVLGPSDLSIPADEYRRMATIYSVLEFATAVKPWVLEAMLDLTGGPVTYLDPDLRLYAPIGDVDALAAEHGIVLTPHLLAPMPFDGKQPDERIILVSGTYNLGFLAVADAARPMLRWWQERLARHCISQPGDGYFVDQKWIDLVPTMWPTAILRDPEWNVAYWNVDNRPLGVDAEGNPTAAGRRLRFFHFSGYSPDAPDRLSKYIEPNPRVRPGDDPVLQALCDGYGAELLANGYREFAGTRYALDTGSDEGPLYADFRRQARDLLLMGEGGEPGITAMPDPFGADGTHELFRWIVTGGGRRPIVPPAWKVPPGGTGDARGVNVVGYANAESGVGEITRQVVATLKAAGIPYRVWPYTNASNRQEHPFADLGQTDVVFDVNIVCINADQFPAFAEYEGRDLLAGRYTIGVWAWEVDRFPRWMARSERYVDEVWGISRHGSDPIAAAVGVPVRTFTLPVAPDEPAVRTDGYDERPFTFFFACDLLSVFQRKNPMAVAQAFTRAFRPHEGPRLVLKTTNGRTYGSHMHALAEVIEGRKDVTVVDGYLAAAQQRALMRSCDVYVSLHRAEGYGLTLAEAMACGKPVIATGYSGNLDFMDDSTGVLVPWTPVPVPNGCDPYPAGATWAEPDVDAAAEAMRRLYADPAAAAALGAAAREHILTNHSPAARAAWIAERIDAARGTDRKAAVA